MMRRFERAGLQLAYADEGTGALPVVFQHGLCGDAAQPREVFPAGSDTRLITLECRGHGGSQAGDPVHFSLATFADDLAALVESLDVGPVVLGGISMGAAIALRLAVTRPDLVRALILARPAWIAEAAPANMRPNAEVGALLAAHPPEMARALFEASPTAARLAAEAPDNLASLKSFFDRAPQAVTAALLTRISADGPGVTEAGIAAIGVPVLVLGTGADAIHPLGHAETLARLIPGARLATIASKAVDRIAYVAEFRAALSTFLGTLLDAETL